MSDDLHTLHDHANNALVRLLSERVRDMRSGVGYISPPAKALAGIAPVPADAAKKTGQGGDIGGSQGGGVKL